MIHNIPQPAFEELIAKRLLQSSLVEIRKNHTFISLEQVSNCSIPEMSCNGHSLNHLPSLTVMLSQQSRTVIQTKHTGSAPSMWLLAMAQKVPCAIFLVLKARARILVRINPVSVFISITNN